MRDTGVRVAAGLAAITALAGGCAVIGALSTLPHPWIGGYVSEAGVSTNPGAWLYRIGIGGLCVGLALLGTAIALANGRLARAAPIAASLLLAGGALGSVSAAVSCSPGCPLPPYEHAQTRDLVHAGASSLAVGLAALAMLVITVAAPTSPLRRLARIGFALTAPPLAGLGIGLLAIGRGTVTAVLERVVLTTVLIWLIVTAAHLGRHPSHVPIIGAVRADRERRSRPA